MKCVHVLRKPCCEPTVAANVLKHGTGALNIDATRIGYESGEVDFDRVQRQQHSEGAVTGAFGAASLIGKAIPTYKPTGRWPANLIIQHLDGCEHIGTKEVRVVGCTDKTQHIYEGGFLGGVRTSMANYASKGRETVAAWVCAPGCPVAALDAQSGDLSSQATRRDPDKASRDTGMFGVSRKQKNGPEYLGQTGGASRFFKQVKP